jgi:hypothetical protein
MMTQHNPLKSPSFHAFDGRRVAGHLPPFRGGEVTPCMAGHAGPARQAR